MHNVAKTMIGLPLIHVLAVIVLMSGTSNSLGIATMDRMFIMDCFGLCRQPQPQPRRYRCFGKVAVREIFPGPRARAGHNIAVSSHPLSFQDDVVAVEKQQYLRRRICMIPEPYNSLQIGETIFPFQNLAPELVVKRLANTPDIFLVKKMLPLESEKKSLMDEAVRAKMSLAETMSGPDIKRRGSHVAWIDDEPSSSWHQDQSFSPSSAQVAHYMANLSAGLFLPNTTTTASYLTGGVNFSRERLQVVRYEPGGAFDLHHDSQTRFLTVLTYLNGVADTWFPYAQTSSNSSTTFSSTDNDCILGDRLILRHGETPGLHGLLVVGSEQRPNNIATSTTTVNAAAVVHIEPGDAVVFYNYDFLLEEKDDNVVIPMKNWRAIHTALPAVNEKWIATNWFSFHEQ